MRYRLGTNGHHLPTEEKEEKRKKKIMEGVKMKKRRE